MSLKKLKIIFGIILVVVFLSDFLVHRHHPVFIWDKIPGFYAAIGLIASIFIIVLAKIVAPAIGLVKKEENHD